MKVFIFLILFLTASSGAFAQFTFSLIGVDGLTCSACSFGTEKSILKLPFVDKVEMDLNENTALVTFKDGHKVDIDALVKKVYDAGFSVRFIKAGFDFKNTQINKEGFFIFNQDYYYFLNPPGNTKPETATLVFIDNKYLPKKELKAYKDAIDNKKSIKPGPGGRVFLIKYD